MEIPNILKENVAWLDNGTQSVYSQMVRTVFPSNQQSAQYTQDKYYSWRIFGSPYMLLDDPPELSDNNRDDVIGEWYYSQLQQSQILTLKMGQPKYTADKKLIHGVDWLSSTAQVVREGESVLSAIGDSILASIGLSLSSLNEANQQYIFYNQYEMYLQYVRLLIVSMASYLGVMEFPIPTLTRESGGTVQYKYTPIKKVDWSSYTTNGHIVKKIDELFVGVLGEGAEAVGTIWTYMKGQSEDESVTREHTGFFDVAGGPPAIIQFVVQPVVTTDSFTNETTQSSASVMANRGSEMGREVAWLTNTTGSFSLINAITETVAGTANGVQSAVENIVSDPAITMFGSSVMGMIRGLNGERMIFPQIYSNSSFNKGFSFVIKLVSPQGDPYSYFMNIGLPLCYIIPMVAPLASSVHAFKMPFMCQAYVTGQAAIPMAIVENVTIQRGGTGVMNKDGLPLEVEVNMTIKDLYNALAVSAIHDPAQFLSNQSLIEYIASFSGIETWNKSLMNKYLSGQISPIVAQEGLSLEKNLNRLAMNLGKWGAEQIYLYNQANAAR